MKGMERIDERQDGRISVIGQDKGKGGILIKAGSKVSEKEARERMKRKGKK
jgi:hypothetical protein